MSQMTRMQHCSHLCCLLQDLFFVDRAQREGFTVAIYQLVLALIVVHTSTFQHLSEEESLQQEVLERLPTLLATLLRMIVQILPLQHISIDVASCKYVGIVCHTSGSTQLYLVLKELVNCLLKLCNVNVIRWKVLMLHCNFHTSTMLVNASLPLC